MSMFSSVGCDATPKVTLGSSRISTAQLRHGFPEKEREQNKTGAGRRGARGGRQEN